MSQGWTRLASAYNTAYSGSLPVNPTYVAYFC